MPALILKCSKEISPALLGGLSKAVSETIGKPEKYVMVVAERADVMMSGEKGDAAYAEVKSIGGLDRAVNEKLTIRICELLNGYLGIATDRIYVTFQSVSADHWGWNNSTFG